MKVAAYGLEAIGAMDAGPYVHIEREDTRGLAGCDARHSVRPACPPFPDLRLVDGGVEQAVLS
jgi:hypothetical protein